MIAQLVLRLRRRLHNWLDRWIPELSIFEHSIGAAFTEALGWVCRRSVPELLKDGPRTAAELAPALGVQVDALHRLMRALAHRGIFKLHEKTGSFELTPLSRCLLDEHPSRRKHWVQYFSARSNLSAWTRLDETLKTGHNGFELANGDNVWDWFAEHPDEQHDFAEAMAGLTRGDVPFLLKLYRFEELTHVCDVAGGRGELLGELLGRFPRLSATLCDHPGVLGLAAKHLEGFAGRVELAPGDIFSEIPAGKPVYMLKNVLHDWDDERCRQILNVCRRAMKSHSKLLIVEALLDPNQSASPAALSDLQMMMVCCGGRERSLAEFSELLKSSGLRLNRAFPGAVVSVLEAAAL